MPNHYKLAGLPAIAKSKTTNRWVEIDVTNTNLNDLYALYREVEVPVLNFFDEAQTLFISKFESELRNLEDTLTYWFGRIADRNLNLPNGHPTLEFGYSEYIPLNYHLGTKIQPAKSGYHPSHDVSIDDYDDIIVTLPDISQRHVHDYCLFTVNGFVFNSKYQDYGVRVCHAGDLVRNSEEFNGGIINFEKVGKVKQVPITPNMITKIDTGKTWFDKITIDTTTYVGDKSVGIVIGGYLHLLDDMVKVIGPTTVTLSMRNYALLDRISNSMKELDLTFMGLDDINNSSSVGEFLNEDNIYKYLTSKYSFLVIIDNPNLEIDKYSVSTMAMSGTYIVGKDQRLGFLTDQIGKAIDYWPIYECGQWALKSTRFELDTLVAKASPWEALTRINDAAVSTKPTKPLAMSMHTWSGRVK